MKYTTKRTKQEIIDIIVKEFSRIQSELDTDIEVDGTLQALTNGKYIAMYRLLSELQIYER